MTRRSACSRTSPTIGGARSIGATAPIDSWHRTAGFRSKHDAVFIQSFEVHNLQKLNRMTRLPRDFQIGDPANPLFAGLRGDLPAELKLFFGLGLDGMFTDQSDVAVGVRTGLPPCDER